MAKLRSRYKSMFLMKLEFVLNWDSRCQDYHPTYFYLMANPDWEQAMVCACVDAKRCNFFYLAKNPSEFELLEPSERRLGLSRFHDWGNQAWKWICKWLIMTIIAAKREKVNTIVTKAKKVATRLNKKRGRGSKSLSNGLFKWSPKIESSPIKFATLSFLIYHSI